MKNKSKAAYDITTLQYYANDDGNAQKYVDDMGNYSFFFSFSRPINQIFFNLIFFSSI